MGQGQPVAEVATRRPVPALRPYVDGYVGYRFGGFARGVHQGLPSRHMTLIISLDGPVEISAMPDPRQAPAAVQAPVAGLQARPATITHDGRQFGISLELSPLGARRVLGLPAKELASTVVELGDVLGGRAGTLIDRLAEADGWPARFSVLDDVLTRALVEAPLPPAEVTRAWGRMVASAGIVRVQDLAEDVGWSRRHLTDRFRAEMGVSPKVAARILRFERAVRLLRSDRRPGLAEVAVACGYFDQAHLNRDWRELAGCTPTAWMTEALPPVGDPGP